MLQSDSLTKMNVSSSDASISLFQFRYDIDTLAKYRSIDVGTIFSE